MKIIIFYASYGGGHLNAAKSILEYIQTQKSEIEVEMIDCMKYVNKTIEKITTAAYREAAKKMPWVWGRVYQDSQKGPLAHISSRSNKIMAIKLLKLLREKGPDLIISTHPFGSQMCSYLKRKGKITSQIATILTDFAPHDQWLVGHEHTDYFFVSNEDMKTDLMQKEVEEQKIHVTGIPLSSRFLKYYDRKQILSELGLEDNKKNILFFGGGEYGLGKSRTMGIFEDMVSYCQDTQMIAISGKNEKMKEAFEDIVKKQQKEKNIKILSFTDKVPQLMSISDLVVTKPGGMTTTESLASHLPMLIMSPLPGQEEENAKFLEKNGVGIWLKKSDNVLAILEDLLSTPKKLEDMKKATKRLAKPDSTCDICKILKIE